MSRAPALDTPLQYAAPVTAQARGYASDGDLISAYRKGRFARSWWLGPRLVSGQLASAEGAGLWKTVERLPTTAPDTLFPALEAAGVHHPASYADAYHQLAPKVEWRPAIYNRIFEGWSGGPWSEARRVGEFRGRWYRYDLRQAYRWAATLGLPEPSTYRLRPRYVDAPGLWLAELKAPRPDLPNCFHGVTPVVVSTEEIEVYGLRVKVWRGVTWERVTGPEYVERTLERLPCPREAGRAFWGRWIARDPLVVRTAAKEWQLTTNPWRHFIWGWLIVGRVRLRVWQAAPEAAHVYVDEIVVPHQLPLTEDRLGAWRPKSEYPDGITVHRTGHFGPRRGTPSMQTGEPRNAA